MLVRSFWGVKATQDVDLPKTHSKLVITSMVTDCVLSGSAEQLSNLDFRLYSIEGEIQNYTFWNT